MSIETDEKLNILRQIKDRIDGNVLISTRRKKNRIFCVDNIKTTGLFNTIVEVKEGGYRNSIAVSNIREIKELNQKVLYPKPPDVK
jgi:hypothetical protein